MLKVSDLGIPASKKITEDKTIWSASQTLNPDFGETWETAEDLLVTAALAAFKAYGLTPIAYGLLPDEANNILRLVIA